MLLEKSNAELKEHIISFLSTQKKLFDFVQQHSELLVQFNPEEDLNDTYIGKCGHRYPYYYRIADIALYGERYQICCCAICNGQISFIPYPDGWISSEEIPGVPIDILPENVIKYINLQNDIDCDFDASPGIFRDIKQHAMMMKFEIEHQKK
jgi:hypothetical protein